MESIKEMYKIGNGPSSSHTMGPAKASRIFKERNPSAATYHVTLYGSLAATGKGHLTDKAIIESFAPVPVEISWKANETIPPHTNGMVFKALNEKGSHRSDLRFLRGDPGSALPFQDGDRGVGNEDTSRTGNRGAHRQPDQGQCLGSRGGSRLPG